MELSIRQISELLQGEIVGDESVMISAPCKIEEGFKGGLSFLSNLKYEPFLYESKASAVLVSKDFVPKHSNHPTLIKVENVYNSMTKLLHLVESDNNKSIPKVISKHAIIGANVKYGQGTSIGDFTKINDEVEIGDETIIGDHVFIGKGVKIGKRCNIYTGVKIFNDCEIGNDCIIQANSVIGSDGFGFAPNQDGSFTRIPQLGNVVIKDNVDIGANCTIDRATIGSTLIEKGVKLDNLIQVAHNVKIGENTVIAAQSGIAGSTQIGQNCMIGGQVGIAGHIKLANRTSIQAKSGVNSTINEEGRKLYGYPAIEYQSYLKSYVHFKNLDQIAQKIKELTKALEALQKEIN